LSSTDELKRQNGGGKKGSRIEKVERKRKNGDENNSRGKGQS